jgi:hypothetical protein
MRIRANIIYHAAGVTPTWQYFQNLSLTYRAKNNLFFAEPMHQVDVVAGQEAVLPCNTSTPFRDDYIKLVLWFKNNSTMPIYS